MRYTKAFNNIVNGHFLKGVEEKQVIVLISHSDGINPFLSLQDPDHKIKKVCYCGTLCYELLMNGDNKFEIGKLTKL